jgi:hypothetical protein
MVSGDFKEIDWQQTLNDMEVPEIAALINPYVGAIATLSINTVPSILDAIKSHDMNNDQEMVGHIMDAFLSGIGPVATLSGALFEKLGDITDVTQRAEAETMYYDMKELEDAGYQYEKLVSAELYTDATKQASKIKQLADKFMTGAKKALDNFKTDKGTMTGGAAGIDKPFELGLSYDVNLTKNSFVQTAKQTLDTVSKIVPIAYQLYKASEVHNEKILKQLQTQIEDAFKPLRTIHQSQKFELDSSLKDLTQTKNQQEYSKLYETYLKQKEY